MLDSFSDFQFLPESGIPSQCGQRRLDLDMKCWVLGAASLRTRRGRGEGAPALPGGRALPAAGVQRPWAAVCLKEPSEERGAAGRRAERPRGCSRSLLNPSRNSVLYCVIL